jgi:hypothetical protein
MENTEMLSVSRVALLAPIASMVFLKISWESIFRSLSGVIFKNRRKFMEEMGIS